MVSKTTPDPAIPSVPVTDLVPSIVSSDIAIPGHSELFGEGPVVQSPKKQPELIKIPARHGAVSVGGSQHGSETEPKSFNIESQSTKRSRSPASSTSSRSINSTLPTTWKHLLLHLIALLLLATVVLFVQGASLAQQKSNGKRPLSDFLRIGVSTTIAVLRAAQGILSALTSTLLYDAFVILQWSIMASADGLSYADLLALSPTTPFTGLFSLWRSSNTNNSAKNWALVRSLMTMMVWVSGLVLFFNTSIITVYDTATSYNATAGVGTFNGSLVQPFLSFLQSTAPGYPYAILPYTYYAAVYTLVLNPLISTVAEPVSCPDGGCSSYLLSGGLELVTPWVPDNYVDYPLVRIEYAPSLQLDFASSSNDQFQASECDIFGQEGFTIGIRFCLASEPSSPETLRAGLFICLNGTDGENCQVTEPAPNITTVMSMYSRRATVVAARSNYSIVSVEDTTPPIAIYEFDVNDYRSALSWILNYTAANIPAPSSVAQSFWSAPSQLNDNTTYGILAQNFQSIIAFPLWLFHENNWGNTELKSNKIIDSLPPEFYTQASIVTPYSKIRFEPALFGLFVALQGLAMIFVWGVIIWVWLTQRLVIKASSYPLFDLSTQSQTRGEVQCSRQRTGSNADIIKQIKDVTVHVKTD